MTRLSVEDLAEVYEARVALEPLTVARAARRFTAEDERRAQRALDRLRQTPESPAVARAEAHRGFHFSLYRAAGSRWLLRLIEPVWESSDRYWLGLPPQQEPVHRRGEHAELVAACADHDADRAEALLRDHLTETANFIAALMGGPVLFPDAPNADAPPEPLATASEPDRRLVSARGRRA